MKAVRTIAFTLAGASFLFAHAGEPLQPHDLWSSWRFDPGVVFPLAISVLLYGRGASTARGISGRQRACFWAGLLTLVIALISPVHPLGEVLFSAHMAQHEILMLIAAPLLVISRPLVAFLWGLRFEWRRTVGRWSKADGVQSFWSFLTAPLTAWIVHAVALWVWHVPLFFQATLESEWIHSAQHLSFFLSALLFWWALFHARYASCYGAGVLYIFTTAIHTSILGALLTFAPTLWYPEYAESVGAWGLKPLEDQQLGGLIMWVPGGVVYLIAGLWLFAEWLRYSDVALARRRQYAD